MDAHATSIEDPRRSYWLARALTVRGIGLVFACAFGSLLVQIIGLYGEEGILPAREFLDVAGFELGRRGENRWLALPTLFWLEVSDAALRGACWAGLGLSLSIVLGWLQRPALLGAWALYLSLCSVGRTFLEFQWDALLLEAALCAWFLAPRAWTPSRARREPVSLAGLLLVRWLCLRLMLLSGLVKLIRGDSSWSELTALDFHYWTQPLPTWIGWWAHQVGETARRFSCGLMFATELYLPFFVFGPRVLRRIAGVGLIAFQLAIALTGNYGFFNLLSVVLCVPLLDDAMLLAAVPSRWRARVGPPAIFERRRARPLIALLRVPLALAALALAALGGVEARASIDPAWSIPAWVEDARDAVDPFRSVNAYGLFSVMTKERGEIAVEGSADGREWKAYRFHYKPGDPLRAPAFLGPHMPRLDWQMWFAALDDWRRLGWFHEFQRALLRGREAVEGLLAENPFPGEPPRYLRARFDQYRFATREERAASGAWWHVEPAGAWSPVLTLDEQGKLAIAR